MRVFGCKGDSMMARVGRIAIYAAVYCVWQECNQIIFCNKIRTLDVVVKDIEDYVGTKAWDWHWILFKNWGIDENRLTV